MTKEEIEKYVSKLNEIFNCKPCRVIIKKHLEYGAPAYYWNDVIYLSEATANSSDIEGTLAHEFGHHLQEIRRKLQKRIREYSKFIRKAKLRLRKWDFGYEEDLRVFNAPAPKKRKRQKHHDKEFARCLKKIIEKTGAPVLPYEYKTVRKYLINEKEVEK